MSYTYSAYWQPNEYKAQLEAHEISMQIADEEWKKGNTKYAFEAYEAAGVKPSEILEKAKALLEAEKIQQEWCIEIDKTTNLRGCGNNWVIEYCSRSNCPKCLARKSLNKEFADKIYKILKWNPEPNYTYPEGTMRDYYAGLVLDLNISFENINRRNGKFSYRSAAVAALKLTTRIKKYTEKPT